MTQLSKRQKMWEDTAGRVMDKKVCRLTVKATIHACVYQMIRYRAQSVLLEDADGMPRGLVTKGDIVNAFFNGFHPSTRAEPIMNRPVFCGIDDPVESLLLAMNSSGNDQLFVRSQSGAVTGIVTGWHIVDRIFQSDFRETFRVLQKKIGHMQANDIKANPVPSCLEHEPIQKGMEHLMKAGLNAILITSADQSPAGVLSVTDINRAYIHCVPASEKAGLIMGKHVLTCSQFESLADAIRKMDVLKYDCIFLKNPDTGLIHGVLALSDILKKIISSNNIQILQDESV